MFKLYYARMLPFSTAVICHTKNSSVPSRLDRGLKIGKIVQGAPLSPNIATGCPYIVFYPANMRRWPNVGLLLAHRLLSWPKSKSALSQRLMFAGYVQYFLAYVQFCHAIYRSLGRDLSGGE